MAIFAVVYDSTTGGFRVQKIDTEQIANGAVTAAKIDDTDPFTIQQTSAPQLRHLPYGVWGPTPTYNPIAVDASGYMYFNAVWPDGSVTSSKLADGAVTSGKIASGQVGDGHIFPASILSSKIASGIVGIPHFQPWASGKVIVGQGTTTTPISVDQQAAIGIIIDGAGAAITSGEKGHIEVPFPATINRVTLACDQSGNIDLDIYKGTYGGFPPTASICSGAWPHTSGGIKYQDSVLSNWVKSVASGDILAFVAKGAASSIQRCTVSLGVYK